MVPIKTMYIEVHYDLHIVGGHIFFGEFFVLVVEHSRSKHTTIALFVSEAKYVKTPAYHYCTGCV